MAGCYLEGEAPARSGYKQPLDVFPNADFLKKQTAVHPVSHTIFTDSWLNQGPSMSWIVKKGSGLHSVASTLSTTRGAV